MGLWKATRLRGHPVPFGDAGRLRRPLIAGAGWLAAAGIATVLGMTGIRLVGESLTGTPGGVLSQDEVDRALAAGTEEPAAGASNSAGSAGAGSLDPSGTPQPGGRVQPVSPANSADPAVPAGTATPTPAASTTTPETSAPEDTAIPTGPATAPVQRIFTVSGGSAIASCPGGLPFLNSWFPAQGYAVKDARQGPGGEVRVRFEGSDGRSEIRVSCAQGIPVARTKDD